jgi:conjugative transfer signal peptidase TraF
VGTGAIHLKQGPAAATQRAGSARRRRTGVCLAFTLAGAAFGLLSLQPLQPVLVWNHTESVPIGLYSIESKTPVRGDVVVIAPTGALQAIFDDYGVLPSGRLLLKQLAAASGDTVCRRGVSITINGVVAATAKTRTAGGRALPQWTGCRTLGADDVVVLTRHGGSFDSRYLGPIGAGQIVGVAHPLVTLPASEPSFGEAP